MTRDEYHSVLFADEIAAEARDRRLRRRAVWVLTGAVSALLAAFCPAGLPALLLVHLRYRRRGRLLLLHG